MAETGAKSTCKRCGKPIYQFSYEFGGKTYTKWKHESDKNKREDTRHPAEVETN